MSDGDSTATGWNWRVAVQVALLVAVAIAFAVGVWQRRWMSDDGLINIRIVQNLIDGYGPVFNVGERVEAYTSPLWLGVIAVLGFVGIRPEYAAAGAGGLAAVAGLLLAQLAAVRLRRPAGTWREALGGRVLLPAGAIVYAALPAAWDYGTSGLETGLTLAWMGGTYLAVAGAVLAGGGREAPSSRRWRDNLVAALVGLGPLVRPELALHSIAFALPLLWSRGRGADGGLSLRRIAELLGAAGAVPVLHQIWRMGYFAAVVPNTAIAKSAFASRWQQGWYYTENFFGLYLLVVPLVVLALFFAERVARAVGDRRVGAALLWLGPVAAGFAQCLYVVYIGGGFMHGRLFLPGLFGMLLPVAVVGVGKTPSGRVWRIAALVAVIGWAVYCASLLRPPKENYHGVGDERGWYARQTKGTDHPITLEDYRTMYFLDNARRARRAAEKHCPTAFDGEASGECERIVFMDNDGAGRLHPDHDSYPLRERVAEHGTVLAVLRIGIGMQSLLMGPRIQVVDRVGLASPIAARLQMRGRGRPGHERMLPNKWFVARFAAPTDDEAAVVSAGRRALECGRLGRLDRAVTEPLTVGRFLTNILEAVRLRGMVIPRDPHEAEEKYCGRQSMSTKLAGGSGGAPGRWYCPTDHLLVGLEVTLGKEGDEALAAIRPMCRRLESSAGGRRAVGEPIEGPRYGEGSGGSEKLVCPEGRVATGLEVTAGEMVRGIALECGELKSVGGGEESDLEVGERRLDGRVGRAGESTRLECPHGSLPAGIAARAGALVDAVGLRCRYP